MYILTRSKGQLKQTLWDDHKIDHVGYWSDEATISPGLPLTFTSHRAIMWRAQHEHDLDPDWEYQINEYLD